jgi:PAS domain S-box-containing protein
MDTNRDQPLTGPVEERDRPHDLAGWPAELPQASQARLAGILDIADDAIISMDHQHRITLFNQGAEKIFGYSAQEVLGQPLDLLLPARFVAAHRHHVEAFGVAIPTARRMGERSDIYGRRKDGSEFPAEASISRLKLANETIFTVILRDITARKHFEQALQEQNAELERALQVKDRFLASMSHELRTPLNAIIGFTGTLLMRLPGPLTTEQEKQLRTVRTSAHHLLSLINDLLDLARIESGKVAINREPVVCQGVLQEVVDSLRPMAEAKGLQFTIKIPGQDVIIQTDRRALCQVMINLANNAIKFTERGEVRLELDRRASEGLHTEIRVTDTGIGIRREDQPGLFDAFGRGEALARPGGGAGLGLHLSQKLAALLGGYITVQSEYGKGSTFTLVLPES